MIDYYFDKKLEIKAQQTILKQNSIKLMRELKDMKKTNYFNDNEVKYSISDERRQWINTLKNPNNQFNLALTLNFTNANYSNNFNLSLVQNKLNNWWKLYCSYHLGRDASKYKAMSYMGTIEHINSNLHAHLAIKHIKRDIDDEFIYDEEQRVETLWKSVQQSGSAYLDNIFDYKWFYYITKESGFSERIVFSPK